MAASYGTPFISAEYNHSKTCDYIKHIQQTLTNRTTNAKVIKKVWDKENLECLKQLPNLIVAFVVFQQKDDDICKILCFISKKVSQQLLKPI